jgi:hypothetical protein
VCFAFFHEPIDQFVQVASADQCVEVELVHAEGGVVVYVSVIHRWQSGCFVLLGFGVCRAVDEVRSAWFRID